MNVPDDGPFELAAYMFRGVVPYGVRVVCAATVEEACKAAGIQIEDTEEWLANDGPERPFKYQRIERGQRGDYEE